MCLLQALRKPPVFVMTILTCYDLLASLGQTSSGEFKMGKYALGLLSLNRLAYLQDSLPIEIAQKEPIRFAPPNIQDQAPPMAGNWRPG